MNNQKKIGAIFLYIVTILNTVISLFLTPFILYKLGDVEYGIYRTVQSLTGQLAIVSIGIGTVTTVMISRYNARNDKNTERDKENYLSLGIAIAIAISVLILIVGVILYLFIDTLYANTLLPNEILLVKKLYIISLLNISLIQFRDIFVGVEHAYEKFVFCNGMKVLRLLLRTALLVVCLSIGMRSVAVVTSDLLLTVVLLISDLIYVFGVLKMKAKFHFLDKKLIKLLFTFSLAVFLQTIVNQVNQNLDGVILGAMIPPERVAVYSLALTIYVAFNSLSSAIASMFTPEASRIVQQDGSRNSLMNFVVKVGRYQFFVIAFILGGFISIGQNFVCIWGGEDKMDVYWISLILLIPMGYANMLCGANSVLDALMKRMGRSIILIITALCNAVVSIILVNCIDYWGAAIGTATSVVIGQILILSIYYKKVFGFSITEFYKRSTKGIILAAILSIVIVLPLEFFLDKNYILFVIKGVIYVTVYLIVIYVNKSNVGERVMINQMLGKIKTMFRR